MPIRQRRPRAFVDDPPPSLLLQDTLNGNELYELVRMTAAFGVDGLPLDVPQEAAVRDLLETELPPWRDDDDDARGATLEDDEPEDPHGYVPRDAAVASTPKKLASHTDFALSRAQSRVSESLTSDLHHLRDDDDPRRRASGSSPPRSPSHPPRASSPSGVGYFAESPRARAERQRRLEAEYEAVTRAMAEHASSRSAERPSTEPRVSPPPFSSPRHSVASPRVSPRPRPAPRSASPRRPAWGGSGADVSRFERALRRSRREGAPPKSPEERVAEHRRRERNAASARAAEEAAVARMRWARERGAKPGERAGQWRAPSAEARDAREPAAATPRPPASVSVSASGMNPGERLYRRGMWDKARKEQRAEAVAAEMEEGMAPVGMGGRESVRARGMTNVSRMLMSDAAGFEHRQRWHEERRRETAELERLRQLERDVEEERRSGKPRITREAARMRRSVRDLDAWQERKLRRAEFLRAESEARQLAELEGMFTPRIDPRSRRIAAATALRNGDGDGDGDGDANGDRNANGDASARPVSSNAGAKGAYSPRAHEREMARVLAGAALMGAAAMAHATPSPPRGARPETTSDGFRAERRALTFEDDAADENLAGGTASEGSWSARLSPSPSPSPGALRVNSDAATSTIRNSVHLAVEDAPATTRASFEFANANEREPERDRERGSRAGLDASRGFETEPSASTARARAPRHAAFDDAANAKFAPKITAKARAMQREGDVGERLHGLASAPRPKRAPRGTTAGKATGTTAGRPGSAPLTRRSAPESAHGARERPAVPYGGWGAYQYGGGERPATASATGAGTRAAATVKRVPAQVPTRVPARVPTRVPSSGGAVLRAAARAKGTQPRPPEEAEARRRARAAAGAAAARDEKDLGWEGLPGGESFRRSAAVARGVSWNEGYY